jgi:hypothetical protein
VKLSAVLHTGDYHTGSKLALCPAKGAELTDGDIYKPNSAQVKLDKFYTGHVIPWVKEQTKGYRLIYAEGGDGRDGACNHGSLQTFGTDDDAEELHVQIVTPLLNIADEVWAVSGTRAHVGASSEGDNRIARKMGAKRRAEWRIRQEVDGKLFDIRHVGTGSRIQWNRGRALLGMMKHEYYTALENRERIPDYVVRHHVHIFDAVTDHRIGMTGVLVPGWKMSDEYGNSLPLDVWDCGAVIIFPKEGRLEKIIFPK